MIDERKCQFTNFQRVVFETAMEAVNTKNSLCLFIDARGGTGKTFVLNAILAEVRLLPIGTESAIALAT